jgi:chloramphenicol 3-O-phosphotransferase
VLIGGPPAVGKTAVLRHLQRLAAPCACLDADDLWRVRPFEIDESQGVRWERSVIAAVRALLEARIPLVFVSWVFANPEKAQRVLLGVDGLYESLQRVYLVASPEALRERTLREPDRARDLAYGLAKLAEIEALPHSRIDTTHQSPEAVAARIVALL